MATAVAAVLGIAVSASLAWAASQLSGQRVGLSSEPLSVATGLSPPTHSTRPHAGSRRSDDHPAPRRTTTARAPSSATASYSTPAPTVTTVPAAPAPTVSTSAPSPNAIASRSTAASSGGGFAPASATTAGRSGRHGDGGDQHDD